MEKRKTKIKYGVGGILLAVFMTCISFFAGTEQVYADTDSDYHMTGKTGYFYICVTGADGTNSKVKIKAEYSKKDESVKQEVKLTIIESGSGLSNKHNIRFDNGSSGGSTTCTVKTDHGSTKKTDKARTSGGKLVSGKDSDGETIYEEINYTVLRDIKLQYTKEAYTYESGAGEGNGTTRISAKEYNWQNTGTSTLSKKVYKSATTEYFTLQVNMANTGVYPSPNTVNGTYTITLSHPTLNVNFKGNGATSGKEGTQTYTYNESKDLWDVGGSKLGFSKTGCTVNTGAEWNTKSNGAGTSYNQSSKYEAVSLADFTNGEVFTSKSLTLYAQWKVTPTRYLVHYDANGGAFTGASPDQICEQNVYYNIPDEIPQRSGFTFLGWGKTEANASNGIVAYSPSGYPAGAHSFCNLTALGSTVTLYAIWEEGSSYTVHFNANGGTGTMADMECNWNQTYTYPQNGFTAPKNADGETMRFIGWALGKSSTSVTSPGAYFCNLASHGSREVTVYAIWSPYYKVLYTNQQDLPEDSSDMNINHSYQAEEILNGHTRLEYKTQDCKFNTQYTALTESNFTRSGKTFAAWYSDTDMRDISILNIEIAACEKQIKSYDTKISNLQSTISSLERELDKGTSWSGASSTTEKELANYQAQLAQLKAEQNTYQEQWNSYQEQMASTKQVVSPGGTFMNLSETSSATITYTYENGYVIPVVSLHAYYNAQTIVEITYDGNFSSQGYDITASGSCTLYLMKDSTRFTAEDVTETGTTKDIYAKKPAILTFTYWTTAQDGSGNKYKAGKYIYVHQYSNSKITLYAQWERSGYVVNYYGNGATSGSKPYEELVLTEDAHGSMTASAKIGKNEPDRNGFTRTDYEFVAWSTDPTISWKDLCNARGKYDRSVISEENLKKVFSPDATITMVKSKVGSTMELYTSETVTVGYTDANEYGNYVGVISGDLNLYAVWKPVAFTVTLEKGVGIESVSGAGKYKPGQTVTIQATTKEGYHWLNWTGNFGKYESNIATTGSQTFVFEMPEHDVSITANGEANTYTIRFDSNGGTGHINDITVTYDTDVTLPNGADAYKKYTLDGVNVTADVASGAIPQSMVRASALEYEDEEEDEEENAGEATADTGETVSKSKDGRTEESVDSGLEEELEEEEELKAAESVKKAYPSIFLGWALYDNKDKLTPQWKAGDVVRNLTAENNAVITLYAVWDDCPWITASDLYYTLDQAQSGVITASEILSHVSAVDREDGSPILPGVHPAVNKPAATTSFGITGMNETIYTSLPDNSYITSEGGHDGIAGFPGDYLWETYSENGWTYAGNSSLVHEEVLEVTDSLGNTYQKKIEIYVVDTSSHQVLSEGYTRFINEKYYNEDYEHGGLEDNSIWKTNPEYQATLLSAFSNLKNNTPEMTFVYSHEDIEEMKEYVEVHGIGNSKEPDALQNFYNEFMAPNRVY